MQQNEDFVLQTVSRCFGALRQLRQIRRSVPAATRSTDAGCQASTVSAWLDLGSGMGYPKKLFRRQHFQVFDADLNPSLFNSHNPDIVI